MSTGPKKINYPNIFALGATAVFCLISGVTSKVSLPQLPEIQLSPITLTGISMITIVVIIGATVVVAGAMYLTMGMCGCVGMR